MRNLTSFTLSVIQELEDEGRFGTAHVYRSTLRAFQLYWKTKHPKEEIWMTKVFVPATLQGFESYLQKKMLKMNTLSTYLRMLRAIYNRALVARLAVYSPGLFTHVYTGTRADVKRALRPTDMAHVLAGSACLQQELGEAQRWFSLLFLLRGMPFVDLAHLRKCDLQDGVITYRRQKTGKCITVKLTPQSVALINLCADSNPHSPYLLNILGNNKKPTLMDSREEYLQYQRMLRSFNRRLKLLAQKLKMNEHLSTYVARHTWATIAFHKKCAIGIISNALGHSSVKVTETYFKPFENDKLDKMNRMIISYTNNQA